MSLKTKTEGTCSDGLHAYDCGVCCDCGRVKELTTDVESQPRRGPVEALAKEIYYEVAERVLGRKSAYTFDDIKFANAVEYQIWIAVAEFVLERFEGRKRGGL